MDSPLILPVDPVVNRLYTTNAGISIQSLVLHWDGKKLLSDYLELRAVGFKTGDEVWVQRRSTAGYEQSCEAHLPMTTGLCSHSDCVRAFLVAGCSCLWIRTSRWRRPFRPSILRSARRPLSRW
jgi:hypothetical protein